jgi:polyisoprenoid-binding protein YceI
MAPSGQLTSSALQALLQGGELAGSWTLDAAKSEVRLTTRHTWGLLPLTGFFRQFSGSGTITPTGGVTGVFTVAAGSIDTKNPKRDNHLRSADFFNVDRHPDFTLAVDAVTPADDGVRVTGGITIAGQARPLSFDAQVCTPDGEVWLDAEVPYNRADFGMTWNMMGMAPMKGTIVIHAVFTRQ